MADQDTGTGEFTDGTKEAESPAPSMGARLRALLVGQGVYDPPEADRLVPVPAQSGNDLRRERVLNATQWRRVSLWPVRRRDQNHALNTRLPQRVRLPHAASEAVIVDRARHAVTCGEYLTPKLKETQADPAVLVGRRRGLAFRRRGDIGLPLSI